MPEDPRSHYAELLAMMSDTELVLIFMQSVQLDDAVFAEACREEIKHRKSLDRLEI